MQLLTFRRFGASSLIATGALFGVATYAGLAKDIDWSARATKDWSGTCQSCHTVPDPAFETDRAFLRQITETS